MDLQLCRRGICESQSSSLDLLFEKERGLPFHFIERGSARVAGNVLPQDRHVGNGKRCGTRTVPRFDLGREQSKIEDRANPMS